MLVTIDLEPEPEQPRAPTAPPAPQTWWVRARCNDSNGTLSSLFFSDDLIDIARAKAICSRCVVREACLAGALERVEPWGVWGGELIADGRIVAQKRRRGRPPKHPRPEPEVPEVPLPPGYLDRTRSA
ncbi:MAG: WhiB family transcriptional regulator [Acidimicrobiales bacterium]|nr:WhiB family transcriptional regulator [Acidimicrobiales bacterium]